MTALPRLAGNESDRREVVDAVKAAERATVEPLAISARQLAELLSISLRSVRAWDCSGRLPKAVVIGGCKRWRLDEIRAWLSAGAPDRATWETIKSAKH